MSVAYVLLSGGIDSSTCLHIAAKEFADVVGVSINYGQRHVKEAEYAAKQCSYLGCRHRVVDLSGVVPKTMLTDKQSQVPNISYAEIKGVSPTYVPFRNGLLLSSVCSIIHGDYNDAHEMGTGERDEWGLYFGAHAEDAANWAYPDCTPEFIGAMANAIFIGTYQAIRLHTPLQWLDKKAIIKLGTELGVPWQDTWSCYKGEEFHCGVCPTCRSRRQGFIDAGVSDPTVYQEAA